MQPSYCQEVLLSSGNLSEWTLLDRCSLNKKFLGAVKYHTNKYRKGEYSRNEYIGENGIFNTLEKRGSVYKAMDKIQRQNGNEIEFFGIAANTVDMLDMIILWSKTPLVPDMTSFFTESLALSNDGLNKIKKYNGEVFLDISKNIFPKFVANNSSPYQGISANEEDLKIICKEQSITQNLYEAFNEKDRQMFTKISRFGGDWWGKTLARLQELVYAIPQLASGRCNSLKWNQIPPSLPGGLNINLYEDRLIHYLTAVAKLKSLTFDEKATFLCKECQFINPNEFRYCNKKVSSTLFLFDLSGSMNSRGGNSSMPKLTEAKLASKQTLNSIKNDQTGVTNEVAVLGFRGGCVSDPTIPVSGFETDLSLVENRINSMGAGGGTPLAEAIAVAECKLAYHLQQNSQSNGKLIILSDGVATCQKIRPNGVYNSAPLRKIERTISANKCGGGSGTLPNKIKYYTIGFNIAPGTPAERDLQYLAQLSGGKYLNVQNQIQLERAFRKFNRTYIPKENPALKNLSSSANGDFNKGVSQIKSEEYKPALKAWEDFTKRNNRDCHGIYNLALMQEANDFYSSAIENYKKYLNLCPNPSDKTFVEKQIQFLEEEFKQFLLFQKEELKSDLAYLKLHFEKVQNGQSIALAEEFKGFLKEKGDYYVNLPELVGRTEKLFKRNAKEVAEGLNKCAKLIQSKPQIWDRDSPPLLSMTYLNLERLINSF